ncbi:MAG: DNA topoisomerase [Lachnospiraceae bacterium]|jgi:DNA topoisomerase-3|nr:DNA topoisomerase [Lachnospiraceae bacterium]
MTDRRVFIAEKPSVAKQFAEALDLDFRPGEGCLESTDGSTIVTWCVGHLVTMSYPDVYDEKLKKWSLTTIPFIPDVWKYEVIDSVKKQYGIVKKILTSKEVSVIYICTDSGREGEYIYRLVASQAGVKDKKQLRVWIDSQTKEEVLRGIREAKDDSAYDSLGAAAYLRAKEDYLMGINFSRALTLKYRNVIQDSLEADRVTVAVGRVMTCVLGMVVRREREIRSFVKTPFFRISGTFAIPGSDAVFTASWHVCDTSVCKDSPKLYSDTGFKERSDAQALIRYLETGTDDTFRRAVQDKVSQAQDRALSSGQNDAAVSPAQDSSVRVDSVTRKKEVRNAPLLYNLAELQNDCSKFFKISPDKTLEAAQELYEKKLTTYPRTDARVLSTAVAKEITKNLNGLFSQPMYKPLVAEIAKAGTAQKIAKTRYTDDKAITDHYAIIPTGQGFGALPSCSETVRNVYELIARRFLSVFYPPAIFDKISISVRVRTELFAASVRTCRDPGYLKALAYSFRQTEKSSEASGTEEETGSPDEKGDSVSNPELSACFEKLKKGAELDPRRYEIKEGETKPPSRYNSGSMILAMENAGQLIEDDELREQIRGSGIGTSATRAEILKKLCTNRYLSLNSKTQIIYPTQLGEMIFDTVSCSLRPLLDPKLTASWEKGLTMVAGGTVSEDDYMNKLRDFVVRRTENVKGSDFSAALRTQFRYTAQFYKKWQNYGSSPHGSGRSAYKRTGSHTSKAGSKEQ